MNLPARRAAAPSPSQQWEAIVNSAEEEFCRIAVASGNAVVWARECQFALQIILKNEHLQRCPTDSIRNAIINVAAIGLTLNPAMKLAYLVPRDGLCCLDISYQGLVKIATDTNSVRLAKAEIVRRNDKWKYRGMFELPLHEFDTFEKAEARGPIIGVYCAAILHDGLKVIEHMNREELAKVRDVSKAKNGPWKTWPEEMIKKSVIKRAYKSWPKTERLSQAIAMLNEHEGMEDHLLAGGAPAPGLVVEGSATPALPLDVTPDDPRMVLMRDLEQAALTGGLNEYSKKWKALSKEQRQLVGVAEHELNKKVAAGDAPARFVQPDDYVPE